MLNRLSYLMLLVVLSFTKLNAQNLVSTVVGTGSPGFAGDGGQAILSSINGARGVMFDSVNNMIIADMANDRIRKVDAATKIITTIAGNGFNAPLSGAYFGDGGPALQAAMYYPFKTTYYKGKLYIADLRNHVIRMVHNDTMYTVAGTGAGTYGGDNGQAIFADMNRPACMVFDTAGNMFIADMNNHRVRKVNMATGIITTIAGTGASGNLGDGGLATAAELSIPVGLVFDKKGNLYISNGGGGSRIRKVDMTTGIITKFAGTTNGFNGDGGLATAAQLNDPEAMAFDETGNMYISDFYSNRIRRIDTFGIITTFAGGGAGTADGTPALSAYIHQPTGIAFDASGDLFIADYDNHIKKIDLVSITGTATICNGETTLLTAAGANSYTWMPGNVNTNTLSVNPNTTTVYTLAYSSDNFSLRQKTFTVTVVPNPTVTITAIDSIEPLRKSVLTVNLAASGPITHTWSANAGGKTNTLLIDTVNLWPALTATYYVAYASSVCKDTSYFTLHVQPQPLIHTIFGTGVSGYAGDGGQASEAQFNNPTGIAVDKKGNIYIADLSANCVRKIDTCGIINTIAGIPGSFFSYTGDGGPATAARFAGPMAVQVDDTGNVFIVDQGNDVIRKVNPAGIVSTYAGTGVIGFNGDGIPANTAQLYWPRDIVLDSAGNLYISDVRNFRIRKVDAATGIISTVVGNGAQGCVGSGTWPALSHSLDPNAIVFDKHKNLLISSANCCELNKVNSSGMINRIIGNGTNCSFAGNGGPISQALTIWILGGATDSKGNIYLADYYTIRQIDTANYIYHTAGDGTINFSGDGGPAVNAQIGCRSQIAIDKDDNVLLPDHASHRIRRISKCGPEMLSVLGCKTICNGNPVTLTAVGATSFTWSAGGVTTNTISVNPGSSATYTLTGNSGTCTVSKVFSVTVGTTPTVSLSATTNTLCVSNTPISLTGSPSGGSYSGTGVNGSTFDPAMSGVGTFTLSYYYSDMNGCGNTATTVVTVNGCTGLTNFFGSAQITVIPNPFGGMITVNSTIKAKAILYNTLGAIIDAFELQKGANTLHLEHLAPGIYYLEVGNQRIKLVRQ